MMNLLLVHVCGKNKTGNMVSKAFISPHGTQQWTYELRQSAALCLFVMFTILEMPGAGFRQNQASLGKMTPNYASLPRKHPAHTNRTIITPSTGSKKALETREKWLMKIWDYVGTRERKKARMWLEDRSDGADGITSISSPLNDISVEASGWPSAAVTDER